MRSRRDKLCVASVPQRSRSSEWTQVGSCSTAFVRQASRTPRSLHARRKHRLKLRILLFARHDADLDLPEPGLLEQLVQLHLAETKPAVGIKLARFFKSMTQ